MIIEQREITAATRDVAPAIGDIVIPYRPGAEGSEGRTRIVQILAHWPGLDAWEVEVVGIRKPMRGALVVPADDTGHTWRELGGR